MFLSFRTNKNALSVLYLRSVASVLPNWQLLLNLSRHLKDVVWKSASDFRPQNSENEQFVLCPLQAFPGQLHSQKGFQTEPDEPQYLPMNQQAGKTQLWDSTETVLEMNLKKLPPSLTYSHEARGGGEGWSAEPEVLTLPKQPRHENCKTSNVCSQCPRWAKIHPGGQHRPTDSPWDGMHSHVFHWNQLWLLAMQTHSY